MDGVAVDGMDITLFVVFKDAVSPEWTSSYNVLFVSCQLLLVFFILVLPSSLFTGKDDLPCWS